jgi:hypothetical protein
MAALHCPQKIGDQKDAEGEPGEKEGHHTQRETRLRVASSLFRSIA